MRVFKYFSIAILILAGAVFWQKRQADYVQLRGYIFGTYYSIKIRTTEPVPGLQETIDGQFALVNEQMSVFTKDSAINRLNQAKKGEWIATPKELHTVLKTSAEISRQSNGAFDPTVGKLVRLWGFGPGGRNRAPTAKDIRNIMQSVGFDKIIIEDQRVSKTNEKTEINLSAIAKGYAVDLIASKLKSLGYQDFLVDIGGEVYAAGNRSNKEQGWIIGIAEPSESEHKNLMSVGLKDMAVATSGDYNNFYYVNGKKISHPIDPKTGYPSEHNLVSATVFASDCMKADAYATALMSMGEEQGIFFADKIGLAAILFIKNRNGRISSLFSKQAEKLIGGQQ